MLIPVEWPVADLVRRVERALDLADTAISLVGREKPGIDLDALEAPPDKVIAETAMFLRAAAAVPTTLAPGVSQRTHDLACALLPHARHPRVATAITLHPALARDYGAAHIVLTKIGYPDPEFDHTLAAALASPTATARERVPHRELEQAWLASLSGGPTPDRELVTRTALTKGIDLVTGTRDDVYALTHALLYATDFGNSDLLFPQSGADILATVRSALAGALDDDDFDLAGELLLTWPFLDADWDSVSSLAFAVLARVEDEVGILPSLALDRTGYERQPLASRRDYVAAATYHTAYVMGFLCAAMLCHSSYPNIPPPGAARSAVFAEELLVRLTADERQPQWLRDMEALSPTSQAACSSFLLDIALRRAVRRLDLATVRYLLKEGVEDSMVLSPLCAQVAGTLRRLVGCSAIVAKTAHVDQV